MVFTRDADRFLIGDLRGKLIPGAGEVELRWKWLKEIDRVRVYELLPEESIDERTLAGKQYQEWTSADFRQQLGSCRVRIDTVGRVRIAVLPVYHLKHEGHAEWFVALQADGHNTLDMIVNKIEIRYRVVDKSSLGERWNPFVRVREVAISIACNLAIPPLTLEYTFGGGTGSWTIDQEILPHRDWEVTLTEPKQGKAPVVRLADPERTANLYRVVKL